MRNFCAAPWVEGVIYMNGNLQTCSRNSTVFGSLKEQSLEEAWRSETFQNFRKRIAKGEFPDEQCRNCYGNGTARSLIAEFDRVLYINSVIVSDHLNNSSVSRLRRLLSRRTASNGDDKFFKKYLSEIECLLNKSNKSKKIDVRVKNALKKLRIIGIAVRDYLKGAELPEIVAPYRQVNLISGCNARCIMCCGRYNGEIYRNQFMDESYIRRAFSRREDITGFFLNGSEFLLYPKWRELAMALAGDGVKLSISTNGILLTPKNIRFLVDNKIVKNLNVSMDGATKETLESIRVNVKYDRLVKNLKYLFSYATEKKYDFLLTFSFVLMRRNYKEFPLLVRLINSIRNGFTYPNVNIFCQALETYNIPGYNEFYRQEHHSTVDRDELIKVFKETLKASKNTGIETGAFYSYRLKDFIKRGCPFPVFVDR